MNENLMFIGMDFVETVSGILNQNKNDICVDMSDSESKAYKFGVKTALSLLEQMLERKESNEVFVHIEGLKGQEEFDFEDLMEMLGE